MNSRVLRKLPPAERLIHLLSYTPVRAGLVAAVERAASGGSGVDLPRRLLD